MSLRLPAALAPSVLATLVLAPPGSAQVTQPPVPPVPVTAPYAVLTDNHYEVANVNPEPYTGLVFDSSARLWAINPYASTIVSYSAITPAPDFVYPTGLNPISIGVWEPAPEAKRVLVACMGTRAVLMHDAATGQVLGLVRVDSEPADLVVDEDNDWAFVSCRGTNTVIKIDLATFTIADRYLIDPGERPGPLYLDRGLLSDPDDNRVYVAMHVTGTNSVPIPLNAAVDTVGSVMDLAGTGPGLPDEEVVCIDPFLDTLTACVKQTGGLNFELDRNPVTGDLWMLSFDSNNKSTTAITEPLLRGNIGVNRLFTVPGVDGTTLVTAPAGVDIDDWDTATAGAQYAANRSLNMARTLDFLSPASGAGGYALVAGPMSDVIGVFDPGGVRVLEMSLPTRAQCYDVEVWPLNEAVVVALCLGTMTIEIYSLAPFVTTPVASVPLGLDPTPDQVRRGRDIFLDGQRSADGRFTCASCHPGGTSDQLGWMLRGHPCDEKDVMVTQSLRRIVDSFPHHWRGERNLEDFGKAFPGLLGDPSTPPITDPTRAAELADFVVFLQSLHLPANPVEDYLRVINDAKTADPAPNGMTGSAVNGQQAFRNVPNFNGQTCEGCHQQQSGSDSTYVEEVISFAPRVAELEVAHLRELAPKLEDTITITVNGNPRLVNREGFGAAHNGNLASVFNFIFDIGVFDTLSDQEQVDTFLLIKQLDNGTSPACEFATRFTQTGFGGVAARIQSILIAGANNGWNDVVAFGTYDNGAGPVPARFWYDGSQFVPDDPALPTLTWTQFQADTLAGKALTTVLGLPPSNGRRFGIDHDNDGLSNGRELLAGTDPWNPDSDGDGWPDGYEVAHTDDPLVAQALSSDATAPAAPTATFDFSTSRLAKFHLSFDEDVVYTIQYGAPGFPQRTFMRDYFSRADTVVLDFDEPSPPNVPGGIVFPPLAFNAQISLVDRNGNPAGPFALSGFDAGEANVQLPLLANHVADMQWVQQQRVGSSLVGQVQIEIDTNYIDTNLATPDWITQPNVMVFSTLAIHDAATDTWSKSTTFTSSLPSTFSVFPAGGGTPVPYNFEPGPPWIVSNLTNASGQTTIDFVQPGMTPGQQLKVIVMGVVALPAGASAPPYDGFTLFTMQPLFLEDSQALELPGGF